MVSHLVKQVRDIYLKLLLKLSVLLSMPEPPQPSEKVKKQASSSSSSRKVSAKKPVRIVKRGSKK